MKKFLTTIMATLLAVATLFTFTACGKKSDVDSIKEKGVIYIGITNYAPMDYLGPDDEWIGFDADLANMFAEELGVTARFTLINWKNKVMELNAGYIDLIWNGMTADEELGKSIDFSVAYSTNMQCAVIKKSDAETINSVATVKAQTIAVEEGSAGDTVATETLEVTPNKVNAQVDALNEVKAGTSKVAIIDYTMAYSVVGKGQYEDLMIVDVNTVSFEKEVFAVGARKDSDLVAKLNSFFKKVYTNGKLAELATTYEVALNEDALAKL